MKPDTAMSPMPMGFTKALKICATTSETPKVEPRSPRTTRSLKIETGVRFAVAALAGAWPGKSRQRTSEASRQVPPSTQKSKR